MRIIFFILFLLPFLSYGQLKNKIDSHNHKQGEWTQTYTNGSIKYEGQFKDGKPYGIFYYYYPTGQLKAKRNFFNDGKASTAHIFYNNGYIKASGIYVDEMKDSTWNYYSKDSTLSYRRTKSQKLAYA